MLGAIDGGERVLHPRGRIAGGGLGGGLRSERSVGACERVAGGARGFVRSGLRCSGPLLGFLLALAGGARLLVGERRGLERSLGGLVGVEALAAGAGLQLGGVADLGLRIGPHGGELGLELLGIGEDGEGVAGALQVGGQTSGDPAQARRGQADGTVTAGAGRFTGDRRLAGRVAPAPLPVGALGVVLIEGAVARWTPGALGRGGDLLLAAGERAHLTCQFGHGVTHLSAISLPFHA